MFEWQAEQTFAVELEQIENVKAQRRFSSFHFERLQELKRGTPLFIERDHFAIDHAVAHGQIFYRLGNCRKTRV